MVGVLMNVDETDGRGQTDGVPERFDRFGITPIGEIGNGFDQGWLAVFYPLLKIEVDPQSIFIDRVVTSPPPITITFLPMFDLPSDSLALLR